MYNDLIIYYTIKIKNRCSEQSHRKNLHLHTKSPRKNLQLKYKSRQKNLHKYINASWKNAKCGQ